MTDEIMQEDIDEEELEADQYLVFTVKSLEFGFQAMRVQEITSVVGTTELPNAPPYIEGIMNLRGQLASVINFRHKFGLETKENDEDTRIIILEQDAFPIGVVVDSVEEVIKIPDEMVKDVPESTTTSVSEEYITGVGMLDNRLIILLDVDKVLTKTELNELSTISQMMDKTSKPAEKAESKEIDAPPQWDTKKHTGKRTERLMDKASKPVEKAKTKEIDAAPQRDTKKQTGTKGKNVDPAQRRDTKKTDKRREQ